MNVFLFELVIAVNGVENGSLIPDSHSPTSAERSGGFCSGQGRQMTLSNPRAHVKGVSRAKVKTVKLTITVIGTRNNSVLLKTFSLWIVWVLTARMTRPLQMLGFHVLQQNNDLSHQSCPVVAVRQTSFPAGLVLALLLFLPISQGTSGEQENSLLVMQFRCETRFSSRTEVNLIKHSGHSDR